LDLLRQLRRPFVVTEHAGPTAAPGADGPANLGRWSRSAGPSPAQPDWGVPGLPLNERSPARAMPPENPTRLPSLSRRPGFAPLGRLIEGKTAPLTRHCRGCPCCPAGKRLEAPVVPDQDPPGRRRPLAVRAAGPRLSGAVIEAMGAGHLPAGLAALVGSLVEKMPWCSRRVCIGPGVYRTYGFPGSEMDLIGARRHRGGCISGCEGLPAAASSAANQLCRGATPVGVCATQQRAGHCLLGEPGLGCGLPVPQQPGTR